MRRRPWLEVLLILLAVGLLTRLAEEPPPRPAPSVVRILCEIGDPPGILGPSLVAESDGLHRLRLSQWMASLVAELEPDFRLWREDEYSQRWVRDHYAFSERSAPFAVVGDFDGDRAPDAVLRGCDDEEQLMLCLLSNGGTPTVLDLERRPLDRRSLPQTDYLKHVGPGSRASRWEERPLQLATDAFELVHSGCAAIWYYDPRSRNFRRYTTAD